MENSNKDLSYIKTVESGIFIRTKWRKNKKTHQKTLKIKPSSKKVVLGHIGDFEVYVYPFDYPDKVFVGKYPINTMIDSTNVKQLLGAYNQIQWFLSGKAFSKPSNRKGANMRRQSIVSAYNRGLNDQISKEKGKSDNNYNYKLRKRPENPKPEG